MGEGAVNGLRWLVVVVVAGVVGSALYEGGAPSWLVYVVRSVVRQLGAG